VLAFVSYSTLAMEPGAMKLAPATEEALDYEVAPNSEEVAVDTKLSSNDACILPP